MVGDEWKIIAVLFAMAMFCNYKFPKNYILQGIWIIMVNWACVNVIDESGLGLVFPLSIMVAITLINSGYIAHSLNERR